MVPPVTGGQLTYQPIPSSNSNQVSYPSSSETHSDQQIPPYQPTVANPPIEERLPFEIDYRELIIEREIGRGRSPISDLTFLGAYGAVFKGRWRGGTVAISKYSLIVSDHKNNFYYKLNLRRRK